MSYSSRGINAATTLSKHKDPVVMAYQQQLISILPAHQRGATQPVFPQQWPSYPHSTIYLYPPLFVPPQWTHSFLALALLLLLGGLYIFAQKKGVKLDALELKNY